MTMETQQPIRVAMLARVVFPLHGFGGIERHVFHLVTHLARQGARVTLYVQQHAGIQLEAGQQQAAASLGALLERIEFLRYDYTSPRLRPNSILGRQINYPWYTWQLGQRVATAARAGHYDVVHAQGLCAFGYGWLRRRDPRLRALPFIANPHGLEEYRTPDWRKWLAYAPFRALYSYGTRSADRAIATDACTQGDLPRYLKVEPARVVVIPSAIDVAECMAWVSAAHRAALRQRLAAVDDKRRTGSDGRRPGLDAGHDRTARRHHPGHLRRLAALHLRRRRRRRAVARCSRRARRAQEGARRL